MSNTFSTACIDDCLPEAVAQHRAHRQRLDRIAARAKPDTPIVLRVPRFIAPKCRLEPAPVLQDLKVSWAKRQLELHTAPKEPWFSVEEDLGPVERRVPSVDEIQRAVIAAYPDISMRDIKSARRTANVVRPRQVAMYLAKTLTLRSLPEIGRRFGGRDHTTVLHAVNKIARLILNDLQLAAEIEMLKASLIGGSAIA